jgi:hypothetical protein
MDVPHSITAAITMPYATEMPLGKCVFYIKLSINLLLRPLNGDEPRGFEPSLAKAAWLHLIPYFI